MLLLSFIVIIQYRVYKILTLQHKNQRAQKCIFELVQCQRDKFLVLVSNIFWQSVIYRKNVTPTNITLLMIQNKNTKVICYASFARGVVSPFWGRDGRRRWRSVPWV